MTAFILLPEINPIVPPVPIGLVLGDNAAAGANLSTAQDVITDAVGNIYIAGYTYTITGVQDAYVAKVNANGTLAWDASLSDGVSCNGNGVAVDSNGDVYLVGITFNGANNDFLMAKYNGSTGALLWQKTWNSTSPVSLGATLNGIKIDASDNIYVTGTARALEGSGGNNSNHLYQAKMTNPTGDTINVIYEFLTGEQGAGTLTTNGGKVELDGSGVAHFIGQSTATVGGAYGSQIFVQQNNAEPPTPTFYYNWMWANGATGSTSDTGYDFVIDPTDTYLYSLGRNPNLGGTNGSMVLTKHNMSTGDPGLGAGFEELLYPTSNPQIFGGGIDYDGTNLTLCGYHYVNIGVAPKQEGVIIGINPTTGALNWARNFGAPENETLEAMHNDGFGNIVTAGSTRSLSGASTREILILRVAADGSIPAGGPWLGTYDYTDVTVSWTATPTSGLGGSWSSISTALDHSVVPATSMSAPANSALATGTPNLNVTQIF